MAIQPGVYVSSQEYLVLEKQAVYKSEYISGTIVAMSGASRKHNLIVTNIVTSLVQQLRGRPCEVYASDMRVKMPASDLYVYPDVVVVCGTPQFEDSDLDTLLNPTLVIEVLSQSTEFRVAYLLPADIVSRPPSCYLSEDNQPVIRMPNWFSSSRPRLLACL